jgi:hypothetical protein
VDKLVPEPVVSLRQCCAMMWFSLPMLLLAQNVNTLMLETVVCYVLCVCVCVW